MLSCYCVIRDGGMGKRPGKSDKEAFSWGKGVDWLGFGGKLLLATEMENLETLKDLPRSVPIFSKYIFQTDFNLKICFKAAA